MNLLLDNFFFNDDIHAQSLNTIIYCKIF